MSRIVRRGYAHPFRAGLITVVAIVLLTIIGFSKDNPFWRPFQVGAVVNDSAGLKPGSLVRTSGVDVGKVVRVEPYEGGRAARVVMQIEEEGLPVHEDARVQIRPRLFLEGNFVLDLSPGAPGGERLEDGDTIPLTQTSRAVQMDQLFSTLQGPEREDLQVVVQELGRALNKVDPKNGNALTKGESAGEALNDAIKAAADAGTDVERLFRALQGQDRGDLADTIRAFADATAPLADRADDLARLMTELDETVTVFADRQDAVRAGVEQLPVTIATAQRELPKVRAALEPARDLSNNLADAMDQLPDVVEASGPFLDQAEGLLSDEEGGALAERLEPVVSGLARVTPDLTTTLRELDRISVCTRDVLVPTANQTIQDGALTTNLSTWDEFLRSMVGLASAGQNFDGNGLFARAATAQGQLFVTGQPDRQTLSGRLIGSTNVPSIGTRPKKPDNSKLTSTDAPWRFDEPCTAADLPNLSAVPSGPADGSVR